MTHERPGVWGRAAALLALSFLAGRAEAAFVVTGEGLAEVGFSSLSRESDRVLQQFYDASFFSGISEPVLLTAMSFRLPALAGVDYPELGDLDFGRYEITLAEPSPAAAAANGLTSATFADNMMAPVLVRAGALTIPQGSFESNASGVEAEFSFVLQFDTPYPFTPGQDLVLLVRHDGHGDVHGVETRWNFDGYAWTNGTVLSTGDVDDAVGNFGPGDFEVANRVRFTFEPVAGSPIEVPALSRAGSLLAATLLLAAALWWLGRSRRLWA